jgi:hypothetical protein
MNLWSWHSPIAWAIFLVACGVTVLLTSWAVKVLGEVGIVETTNSRKK